jgi:hypothetical protein
MWTPEDSTRAARADSIDLAKDYHRRLGNMESYQSCMAKAKGVEAPARAVIEQACARSHPGGR